MRLAKSIAFALACATYLALPIIANAPEGYLTSRSVLWLVWGLAPITALVALADYRYGMIQKPPSEVPSK